MLSNFLSAKLQARFFFSLNIHDVTESTLEDLGLILRVQKNLMCGGSTFCVMSIDDLLYKLR